MLNHIARRLPPLRRLIEERDALRAALGVDNVYESEALMARRAAAGGHRAVMGSERDSAWRDTGAAELRYLVEHGLEPHHTLLDIGCGPLRGGVHLIPYLAPGNYWGVDVSQALLDAGWRHELGPAGLQDRQPRDQLVCLRDFEFAALGRHFDCAIAFSVFTHLNFNRIRRCLTRLAPAIRPGGALYATCYEAPPDIEAPRRFPDSGATTYSHRDPFHYSPDDFDYAIRGLPWSLSVHGEWAPGAAQSMLRFERLA